MVAAIVGLLVIAFGVILWSWQRTSQDVLDEHANALLAESAEVGIAQSEAYLENAGGVLDISTNLVSQALEEEFATPERIGLLFHSQLASSPAISGVFVGFTDGSFNFVNRNRDYVEDGYRTKLIMTDEGRETTLTFHDAAYEVLDSFPDPEDTYDPRVRPWFESAADGSASFWTSPYVFFDSQLPGITTSKAIFGPDGSLSAVVGVDVELGGLSQFLNGIKIRDDSRVFLINADGEAIAYSETDASLYSEVDGRLVLKSISEIPDPRTEGAFKALTAASPDLNLEEPLFATFEVDGSQHHAYFASLELGNRTWILGSEVSDDAFVGTVREGQQRGTLLAIAIVFIAALLAILLSRSVSVPMQQLRQQAAAALDGEAHRWPRIRSSLREIQETADALTTSQLHLEARVGERTRELQEEVSERREAEMRAKSASNAKTQFLGNMSHELRTPLNAIIGLAELIEGEAYGPTGSERYTEFAGDIVNAGSHLVGLINEILDLTRIESGALTIDDEELDVVQIIGASVKLVEQLALEKGIRLGTDVAEDLPRLMADRLRLRQVLVNLLSNAIKFTPSGGFVTVGADFHDQSSIRIWVEDSGVGMTPEEIEVALSLFGQVESNVEAGLGTGIGLTLTARLVEGHGGDIIVESEPARGTKVTATFPEHRTVLGSGVAATAETVAEELPRASSGGGA